MESRENHNYLLTHDVENEVMKPLRDLGIGRPELGMHLLLQRIAAGDRGRQQESARKTIMDLAAVTSWEEAKVWAKEQIESAEKEQDAEGAQAIAQSLQDAGMTAEDLQALLGESAGIANPYGHTPETAREMLAAEKSRLGEVAWNQVEASAKRFHELIWRWVEEAGKIGVYSQEQMELLGKNKGTYATFAVVEYLQNRIGSGIYHQYGTFKEVADPSRPR